MKRDSLQIDFGNRDDMRAKLPQAREIRDGKRERLSVMAADVEWWDDLVGMLERHLPAEDAATESDTPDEEAGVPPETPPEGADQQVDLVVGVVDRGGGPIRAIEVKRTLNAQGIPITADAVSNSLYYAAKRAKPPRIQKLKQRGTYAPLAYMEPPTTDYATAAQYGMPVADHPPFPRMQRERARGISSIREAV